ncbi:hypothetical protein [Microlunatus ginsengisoli]|jgi:hypothetical protein|uniref:DUF4190 domain-containing protein n=1 Tax=Microlunatus ginsengisoli TaxID=363863 RepID=A0ABP6ZN96_9ACTN
MDETRLHKNAGRVAAVFNALSIVVVIIGVLIAAAVLIAGFVGAGISSQLAESSASSRAAARLASILGGVIGAIGTLVYTVIAWAGVQLSALVAGYIKVRTGPQPVVPAGYPPQP